MTDHPRQVPAEFVPPSVGCNPWHFLVFGFGSGSLPKALGTWGSLVALPADFARLRLLADGVVFDVS